MDLGFILKELKNIVNKNEDLVYSNILISLLKKALDDYQSEIKYQAKSVEYNFSEDANLYVYVLNKKSKKRFSPYEYSQILNEKYRELGSSNIKEFEEKYSEVYDSLEYENGINKAKDICSKLEKLGLKVDVVFDKKYKKSTLKDLPEDIWISMKI